MAASQYHSLFDVNYETMDFQDQLKYKAQIYVEGHCGYSCLVICPVRISNHELIYLLWLYLLLCMNIYIYIKGGLTEAVS